MPFLQDDTYYNEYNTNGKLSLTLTFRHPALCTNS